MKYILLLSYMVSTASLNDNDYQNRFVNFFTEYNKNYTNDEFFSQYNTFNVDRIETHNEHKLGRTTGVNEYVDMPWKEFSKNIVGYTKLNFSQSEIGLKNEQLPQSKISAEVVGYFLQLVMQQTGVILLVMANLFLFLNNILLIVFRDLVY